MLAIRTNVTRGTRPLPSSGALLVVVLGQRLDLGEDREPDQSNERDAETVDVEKAAPGLAQKDDAQHHQPYAAGLQISCTQLSKCHCCTLQSKAPIAAGASLPDRPEGHSAQQVLAQQVGE